MVEVVSQFATRVAEKARQQQAAAGAVHVFITTSPLSPPRQAAQPEPDAAAGARQRRHAGDRGDGRACGAADGAAGLQLRQGGRDAARPAAARAAAGRARPVRHGRSGARRRPVTPDGGHGHAEPAVRPRRRDSGQRPAPGAPRPMRAGSSAGRRAAPPGWPRSSPPGPELASSALSLSVSASPASTTRPFCSTSAGRSAPAPCGSRGRR
jgi:hypothetical protein